MPDIKKYFRPGFVVVTFVILKQAFGTDDAVFLRARVGLILLQMLPFTCLHCPGAWGGTPVRGRLQFRSLGVAAPSPSTGLGPVSPPFDLLGRIFRLYRSRKTGVKKLDPPSSFKSCPSPPSI